MRKILIIFSILIVCIAGLQAQVKVDSNKISRDTILPKKQDSINKIYNDSVKNLLIDSIRKLFPDSSLVISITDSLYNIYYRDSLQQAFLIDSIGYLYNSLKQEIYIDSLNKAESDSIRRNFNVKARKAIQDSILMIDEDSVKHSLTDLSDYIFSDSINSVYPDSLKIIIDRLVDHLANDSINLQLINYVGDTSWLKLKKNSMDSVFVWIQNSLLDSVKVNIQSTGENSIKMWVDDNVFLKELWKRSLDSNIIIDPEEYEKFRPKKIKTIPFPVNPWSWWGESHLHIAQGAVSNWAKGGESSISADAELKAYCNYAFKNSKWENRFEILIGFLNSENTEEFIKNKDRILIDSKFGQKAFEHWYYTGYTSLLTQSFKGFNSPSDSIPVSKFLNPATITFGLGMDYKPNKKLSVLMSPISSKLTIVTDTALINQVRYGLNEDKRIKKEMGAGVITRYKSTIYKNIGLENILNLFTNYMDNPQNIDIEWKMIITMQINNYISTKISTHLIYDDDILVPLYERVDGVRKKTGGTGKRVQFMETLSVGFSYRF
ncbi:DUF3078 domain-containing protein [Bacteroidota bacterium]